MTVVSVLNYKGGVGKTTIAANLGADLAFRGRHILLIDMDPQASLTLSFYTGEDLEKEFTDRGTLLHWFQAALIDQAPIPLERCVVSPPRVNQLLRGHDGRLDLIPSHLGLIDIDLDMAAYVGGSQFNLSTSGYLWVHRLLADALAEPFFERYDAIVIDCAPNFNMVTRTAVVASEHILIPAKADYLSTLGIDYLRRKLCELVRDYNEVAGDNPIAPEVVGILFTMIQYAADSPIIAVRNYVTHAEQYGLPVFRQMIRESKTSFATAGERGIPAVLLSGVNAKVQQELRDLTTEFLTRVMVRGAT